MDSHRSIRALSRLALTLLFATSSPAWGNGEGIGYSPKLPVEPTSLKDGTHLLDAFSASGPNYFTGEYAHSVQIPLPPSRGDVRPDLKLSYSSSGPSNSLGAGWSLEVEHIRRSTRSGTPRYGQKLSEVELEYQIGGTSGKLLLAAIDGTVLRFYSKAEGGFLRFEYSEQSDTWTVRSPSGKTWLLGGEGGRESNAAGDSVFAWYVKKVTDSAANFAEFQYELRDGVLYPTDVKYDLSEVKEIKNPPAVAFEWEDANGASHTSFRKGFHSRVGHRRLKAIKTQHEPKYTEIALTYTAVPGALRAHLGPDKISPSQKPATSIQYGPFPSSFVPGQLLFDYYDDGTPISQQVDQRSLSSTHASREVQDTTIFLGSNLGPDDNYTGPQDRLSRTPNTLVDLDGDGDLDILVALSAHENPTQTIPEWQWRENRSGVFDLYQAVALPPQSGWGESTPRYGFRPNELERALVTHPASYQVGVITTRQRIVDMNGDGKADIVFVDGADIVVCPNTTVSRTVSFGPCQRWMSNHRYLNRTEVVSSGERTLEWTTSGLIDFNADGLPDYVEAGLSSDGTATELTVHLNSRTALGMSGTRGIISIQSARCDEIDLPIPPAKQVVPRGCLSSTRRTYPPVENPIAHQIGCRTRTLIDINGDGLPDLLRNRSADKTCLPLSPGELRLEYGTGTGFVASDLDLSALATEQICHEFTAPGGGASPGGGEAPGGAGGLPLSVEGVPHAATVSDFLDINGDGLKDFVERSEGLTTPFRVRLNTGKSFLPATNWTPFGADGGVSWTSPPFNLGPYGIQFSTSASFAAYYGVSGTDYINVGTRTLTQRDFIDLDGDGLLEFVAVLQMNQGGETPWMVHRILERDSTSSPGRATRLEMETGVTLAISYQQLRDTGVPIPLTVVSQVKRMDMGVALPESTSTQRVSYLAPAFDTEEREFRGFGETRITEGARDPADGAVRERRTQFSQTDYNAGTPTFEELFEPNLNSTVRQVRTTFEFQALGVHASPTGSQVRGWTRPTQRDTRTFHPDNTSGFLTTTAYRYFPGDDARNRLGLLREKAENTNRVERFDYEIQNDDKLYLVRRKLVSVEDAAGASVSLTELLYDDQCTHSAGLSRGLVCEKRVARGLGALPLVTSYTYDDLGRMTREENLDGEFHEHKYADDTAFKTEDKNALGHIRTFLEHHWLTGAPKKTCGPEHVSPWGFFPDKARCHVTLRDSHGRPLYEQPAFETPLGYLNSTVHKTHYEDLSTEKGRPRHIILSEYPDPHQTFGTRLPPRNKWVYLDGAGHVVLEASPLLTPVVMPGGSMSPPTWWSKRYFRYDELGRLVTAYLPITQPDFEYGPQPSADAPAYQYRYDALDRVVEILAPPTPDDGNAIPPTEGFPRLGDANNGEAISSLLVQYREPSVFVRDASGIRQTITHNLFGEIAAISKSVGAATLTTEFSYDVAGRRIGAKDPYGVDYSYKYYFDGSLYSAESPSFNRSYRYTDGGRLQYEYRRIASGDTDGVIEFKYDGAGRITERAVSANVTSACLDPRAFTTKFTYDVPADSDRPGANLGRLTSVEGLGHSYEYDYDSLGVRSRETLVEEATQARLSVKTVRGAHGEIARLEFDDLSLDYSYDEAGRLSAVTEGADLVAASYLYQLDGRLRHANARIGPSTSPERSLAFQRALSYDARGRPNSSRYQLSAIDVAPVADQRTMGFQYYPNGQLRAMTDSEASSSKHEWTYDNALRLSTAVGYGVLAGGQPTDVLTYAYNANSTIQSVTRGSRVETYNYDSQLHSLKSIVVTGSGSTRRTTFEHDGDGNRCGELETVNTSIPALARGSAYSWSADGRLTRVDSFARRTTQVTDYDYDHEGRRWRETTDGASSVLYLGDQLEFSATTGESKKHLSLPGGLSCSIVGHSAWTCHVKDIGNVRTVASSTETVPELSVVDYLPYGQRRGTGPDTLRFGYSGKQEDSYTGLLYYGARYYDPRSRQFLSPDPVRAAGVVDALGIPESLNPYSYGAANPVANTDPSGKYVESLLDVAFIAYDIYTIIYDGVKGNDAALAIDLVALAADVGCLFVPLGTGGGLAARAAGKEGVVLLHAGAEVEARHAAKAAATNARTEQAAAKGEGHLVRFGPGPESAEVLAADAARAEANGFPHGVSTRLKPRISGSDKDHRSAPMTEVQESFPVTQTGKDPRHHTVELPKPVTPEVADKFNSVFKPKE